MRSDLDRIRAALAWGGMSLGGAWYLAWLGGAALLGVVAVLLAAGPGR